MRNVGVILAVASLTACSSGPYCDRDGAESALSGAAPGEVVELGACEVEGPLHVPPGVTLAGTTGSVVVAPQESGGILVLGGETPSVVRDLSVRVEGRVGILARGGGAVEVRNVEVDARRGVGFGAAELATLTMDAVTLLGPVNETNASDARWVRVAAAPVEPGACPDPMGCDCELGAINEADGEVCDAAGRWATWTATYGLVIQSVAAASLTDVDVRGFAQWGVVTSDSAVTWVGGGVHDTLGIGVRQVGGVLDLEDVDIDHTFEGLRGERPYGVITTDGGRLDGRRVVIRDNDRYGVLLSGASGLLEDVVGEGNGDAALWVAGSDDFELCGTGTRLSDNGFAGAVVVGSSGVRLADGTIESTRETERPVGTLGLLRVGDGVHVIDTAGAVELTDLTFNGNGRAGVAIDLGAAGTGSVAFTNVSVTGTGAQLGAIAGRPSMAGQLSAEMPSGWDTGVTRGGATATNDAMFTGGFSAVTERLPGAVLGAGDVLAVVAPMF